MTPEPTDAEIWQMWISMTRRGVAEPVEFARAVLQRWGHPAGERKPMTPEQIKAMSRKHPAEDLCGWSYRMGIADAEAHYGIKSDADFLRNQMNNANHRAQVSDLLDEWTDNPKQAKNIINCLVEFLTDDMNWLNENISKTDRETLIAAAKMLEHGHAPNAD